MRVVRVEGLGNPDHDGESPVERAVFGERPPKASMPRPIQDLVRVLLAAGNPWIRGADLVGRVRSANGDIYSTDQVLAIASRIPSILMVEGELVRNPDTPAGPCRRDRGPMCDVRPAFPTPRHSAHVA